MAGEISCPNAQMDFPPTRPWSPPTRSQKKRLGILQSSRVGAEPIQNVELTALTGTPVGTLLHAADGQAADNLLLEQQIHRRHRHS